MALTKKRKRPRLRHADELRRESLLRCIKYREYWANDPRLTDLARAAHRHNLDVYRNELRMLEAVMSEPSNYRT